jgi:uncharacterized protein YoxC
MAAKIHKDDNLIDDVFIKQKTYDKVLERANHLGYPCVTACVVTKVLKYKDSVRTVANKLSTSEGRIKQILVKLELMEYVNKRYLANRGKQWMLRRHDK